MRDYESTTYVSSFAGIDEFGPVLRQDALRRGLTVALQVVLLIDGAEGLARMGRLCFPSALQIVDFIMPSNTPAKCWSRCWAVRSTPTIKPGWGGGPAACSTTRWSN